MNRSSHRRPNPVTRHGNHANGPRARSRRRGSCGAPGHTIAAIVSALAALARLIIDLT